MAQDPVRVLFLAGEGRSGSTLLGRIIGQADGCVFGGEIRYVWERGLIARRSCECRQDVEECPFWRDVFSHAFGGTDNIDAPELLELDQRLIRLRHAAPMLVLGSWPGRRRKLLRRYGSSATALYSAISAVSDGAIVVDSTKIPVYAHLLRALPQIDLRVIHLVRDPRATVYSWQREKLDPDSGVPRLMIQRSVLHSALLWNLWNALTEWLWRADERYLRIRYEDFVAQPTTTVRRILDFAGAGSGVLPIEDDRVWLTAGHSVSGNPNRFDTGPTRIRLDDEWSRGLGSWRYWTVTLLTWPLLVRYRYRVRRNRRQGDR